MNKYGIMVVFPRSEIPSAILNDDRNARYGHRGSDSGHWTLTHEVTNDGATRVATDRGLFRPHHC